MVWGYQAISKDCQRHREQEKEMSEALALSLSDSYQKDRKLLAKPISSLARMGGLNVNQVFTKLVPELYGKDLGEALKFAETGLNYIAVVDRNRLREELGLSFIAAVERIINLVKDGLNSKEPWIKRKSMNLHGKLIDEAAEKQRFVESLMAEQKFEMIKESFANIKKFEEEIIEFEMDSLQRFVVKENGDKREREAATGGEVQEQHVLIG